MGSPPILKRLAPEQAIWLHFSWRPQSTNTIVHLQNGTPGIDQVSAYWQDADFRWLVQHSGDTIAHDLWPQSNRFPTFKLNFLPTPNRDANADGTGLTDRAATPSQDVFVMLAHDFVPVTVSMHLVDEPALRQKLEVEALGMGLYFGMCLLALLYCTVHALRFADRLYGLYVVLTLSMVTMQLALTGLGTQMLWTNSPRLANVLSFAMLEVYTVAGLYFLHEALALRGRSRKVSTGVLAYIAVGVALTVVHVFAHNQLMFRITNTYAQIGMLLLTGVALWAHRLGDRLALAYLLGFSPILLLAIPPLLRNSGLYYSDFLTQYGLMFGAGLEILLLFVVLNRRSRDMQDTRVRERALLSQDPLTGLSEQEPFKARLYEALVRARRYGHQCGLLRVELENHTWYANEHGAEVADRAVVLTAAAVRKVARDIDTAARLEANEVVLLVEGPCTSARVAKAAAQLLAGGLEPSDALPVGASLKLLIGAALLPQVETDRTSQQPEDLISPDDVLNWLRACTANAARTPNQTIVAINL